MELKLPAAGTFTITFCNSALLEDFTALFQAVTSRLTIILDRPHSLAVSWQALTAD